MLMICKQPSAGEGLNQYICVLLYNARSCENFMCHGESIAAGQTGGKAGGGAPRRDTVKWHMLC